MLLIPVLRIRLVILVYTESSRTARGVKKDHASKKIHKKIIKKPKIVPICIAILLVEEMLGDSNHGRQSP